MMLYTVYKTVNLINGKFYIGVHKTKNPDDDYLGSGKYLQRAVAKHGPEKFRKTVLFIFENPKDAFDCERELVAIARRLKLCMNMKHGGEGGFDWINENGLAALGGSRSGAGLKLKYATDKHYRAMKLRFGKKGRDAIKNAPVEQKEIWTRERVAATVKVWTGKKQKEISKNLIASKLRIAQKGERNSQFGSCWITKMGENQKILRTELQKFTDQGWTLGRTINFGPKFAPIV